MPWPQEEIPDEDTLFRRADGARLVQGLTAACFEAHGDPPAGISTDWSEHCSAAKARHGGKHPADRYAILAVEVGATRAIQGLTVVHSPVGEPPAGSRSHTDIMGADFRVLEGTKTQRRIRSVFLRGQLAKIATIAIELLAPVDPLPAAD